MQSYGKNKMTLDENLNSKNEKSGFDSITTVPALQGETQSEKSIEEIVMERSGSKESFLIQPVVQPVVLGDVENYISNFSERYSNEKVFRNIVHTYLGLSGFGKAKLAITKLFSKKKYGEATNAMIRDYATKIKEQSEKAFEIQMELENLKKIEQTYALAEDQHTAKAQEINNARKDLENQRKMLESGKSLAEMNFEKEKEQKSRYALEEKLRIEHTKNALKMVEDQAKEYLKKTGMVKVSDTGVLTFDEKNIVSKLENLFLKEIVTGIEKDEGPGFLSKTKIQYEGLISHFEEMDDLSQFSDIEWVESAIYSRTKGYRVPTYPYFVVGKRDNSAFRNKKASINTSISVDTSGSMDGEKLELAKKCVMATHALMRKLNPQNETYLSHFDTKLYDSDTVSFFRDVKASGYTNTDLAINWLYNSLDKKKSPGIAYLITDGEPTCDMKNLLNECKRFADNDKYQLRIFLIEKSDDALDKIKQMGKAAGSRTKVIPVTAQNLGKNAIKEINLSIRGMYDIDHL